VKANVGKDRNIRYSRLSFLARSLRITSSTVDVVNVITLFRFEIPALLFKHVSLGTLNDLSPSWISAHFKQKVFSRVT
jgi:hypothetical protein